MYIGAPACLSGLKGGESVEAYSQSTSKLAALSERESTIAKVFVNRIENPV